MSDIVLSGFVRVVTNRRVFAQTTPLAEAIAFCSLLRSSTNASVLSPGGRHWDIFTRLCTEANARANLVPDAYLAAIAIETGSELITADRGFHRFRGLAVRHPLDPKP